MGHTSENRKKVHKNHKAAALLFLAVLVLVCAVNVLHRDREFSENENRMLEQKPELSVSGLESGRFMEQYEAYKSDQFAGRDIWMSIRTKAGLLAGKRESNGIYRGKKGYLLEEIVQPDEEQMKENLKAMKEFCQSYAEVPAYMMLVPNAASVLADHLPNLAASRDQAADFKKIKEELGDRFTWVDASSVLKKHKGEEIYYHTDHHWTTLGAYYAYRELAAVMGLDLKKEPPWKPYAVSNDFNGTLSAKSGYKRGYKEAMYIYAAEAEEMPEVVVNYVDAQKRSGTLYDRTKLEERDQYGVFLGGNHPMISIRTTAESPERLLVIKDSYANSLIPFLTPYYREIIVIDPRYYYGNIQQVMSDQRISGILFLYNGNTFAEDNSISGVLMNHETE